MSGQYQIPPGSWTRSGKSFVLSADQDPKAAPEWFQATYKTINAVVDYVVPIVGLLDYIGTEIGRAVQSTSHGGADDLQGGVKDRLYAVGLWPPTVITALAGLAGVDLLHDPRLAAPVFGQTLSAEAQQKAIDQWAKIWQVTAQLAQEYDRIVAMRGDPMISVLPYSESEITALINARLWPPPIKPFPVDAPPPADWTWLLGPRAGGSADVAALDAAQAAYLQRQAAVDAVLVGLAKSAALMAAQTPDAAHLAAPKLAMTMV